MDPSTKISGNCVNALPAPPPPRRLLDQLSDRIQFKHHSIRTEEAYSGWVRRFILFHNKRRFRGRHTCLPLQLPWQASTLLGFSLGNAQLRGLSQ